MIEARWKKQLVLIPFSLSATVTYNTSSSSLRFQVANTKVPIEFSYNAGRYVVGNVRFRRRLSTSFPLRGIIPRPGPDIEVSGSDVFVEYRTNRIRIEGDIDL